MPVRTWPRSARWSGRTRPQAASSSINGRLNTTTSACAPPAIFSINEPTAPNVQSSATANSRSNSGARAITTACAAPAERTVRFIGKRTIDASVRLDVGPLDHRRPLADVVAQKLAELVRTHSDRPRTLIDPGALDFRTGHDRTDRGIQFVDNRSGRSSRSH